MRTISVALVLVLALTQAPSFAAAQEAASAPSPLVEAQPGEVYGRPLSRAERAALEPVAEHNETNWALVGPGLGLSLGGYALGWLTTVGWALGASGCTSRFATLADPIGNTCPRGPHSEALWQMAIPIVGPWLSLSAFDGSDVVFPVIMGIVQPVGLGMLIAGLLMPEHVPARPAAGQVSVRVGLSNVQLDVAF